MEDGCDWIDGRLCGGSLLGWDEVRRFYGERFQAIKLTNVWRTAQTLPAFAIRIRLKVDELKAQRLWDITEADAKAEGVEAFDGSYVKGLRKATIELSERWLEAWEKNFYVGVAIFSEL